jgi:hypothetical protein
MNIFLKQNKYVTINYFGVEANLFDLSTLSCPPSMTSLHTFPLPVTLDGDESHTAEAITGSPELSILSASNKLLPSVAIGVGSSLWHEDRLATDKYLSRFRNLKVT